MNNMIEALERIAAYPRSRSEEMSIETAREIARAALASQAQQQVGIGELGSKGQIANKKINILRQDGFKDYATAAVLRKDDEICLIGTHGDVRWFMQSQAQQSQWISVDEAKATLKDGDLLFAYCEFYGVVEATYAFEEGYYNPHRIVKKNGDSYRINTFTHFMARKPESLPPAPEVCSDGGKCGAGGYCITCHNMPAPEGEKNEQ